MTENTEISLLKLTPGNYFGDEQGFNEKKMKYSVRVTSNKTKIFLIPKKVSFSPNKININPKANYREHQVSRKIGAYKINFLEKSLYAQSKI